MPGRSKQDMRRKAGSSGTIQAWWGSGVQRHTLDKWGLFLTVEKKKHIFALVRAQFPKSQKLHVFWTLTEVKWNVWESFMMSKWEILGAPSPMVNPWLRLSYSMADQGLSWATCSPSASVELSEMAMERERERSIYLYIYISYIYIPIYLYIYVYIIYT